MREEQIFWRYYLTLTPTKNQCSVLPFAKSIKLYCFFDCVYVLGFQGPTKWDFFFPLIYLILAVKSKRMTSRPERRATSVTMTQVGGDFRLAQPESIETV